jgi:hypothetical protein
VTILESANYTGTNGEKAGPSPLHPTFRWEYVSCLTNKSYFDGKAASSFGDRRVTW